MTSSATQAKTAKARTHITSHTIDIAAPAKAVYGLIADVSCWPYTFGPTVHAERELLGGNEERLHLWAFANGQVRDWTSRRTLDPAALRVRFRQEISAAPVEAMGGEWILEQLSGDATRVTLLHDFRTIDDSSDGTEFITKAVDRNSEAELSALKTAAEFGDSYDKLVLSFADSVTVAAPAAVVYEFLYQAKEWPNRLPHVARLDVEETVRGVQSMEMDTRSTDGSIHTTHSVRVCFDGDSIVYKQTRTPEIMAAHVGRWTLRPTELGVEVTSHHTVVIRPEKVKQLLGPDGTVDKARELIRRALGTNSLATLKHAKQAAEAID